VHCLLHVALGWPRVCGHPTVQVPENASEELQNRIGSEAVLVFGVLGMTCMQNSMRCCCSLTEALALQQSAPQAVLQTNAAEFVGIAPQMPLLLAAALHSSIGRCALLGDKYALLLRLVWCDHTRSVVRHTWHCPDVAV
jgi:hypothetical protein